MPKQNCWELKQCGREPGGRHVADLGLCPAAVETSLDGQHAGKNAGRACWVVAGTLCEGEVQGAFAEKYDDCRQCGFYRLVRDEEMPNYKIATTLLRIMRDTKSRAG